MIINEKVMKPITEAKYLTAENAWRYRSILRAFYYQYEKIKYWMYKEEVFEELKSYPQFQGYTMDQCKQDLDALVEWGNLAPLQDTKKATTIEEFKNKQFRYQLSEYAVEIERMTIKLENLFVEGASLEPTLLERIKNHFEGLPSIIKEDNRSIDLWWQDLNSDFKRLNQNYQDYIRELHSIKAEEMMKTKEFLVFKDKFIAYLRDFVKGLQEYSLAIEEQLKNLDDNDIQQALEKIFQYQQSVPRVELDISYQDIWDSIQGRWVNLRTWFLGAAGRESESWKLFDMTNEIIRKITRYAAQITEDRNSAANRKEEYKKLGQMFLQCGDIKEAHRLSSLAFGIFHTKHLQGELIRKTESINSGIFDEAPLEVNVKPRVRTYREKDPRNKIPDNFLRKQEMLKKMVEQRNLEREIMAQYIKNDMIKFDELPVVEPYVRLTLLRWLAKGISSSTLMGKTEDGAAYKIIRPKNGETCTLYCEDGELLMPAYHLVFSKEANSR